MKALWFCMLLLIALPACAAQKTLLNLDKSSIAIQGYDPVAFFTENKPVKGNSDYQSTYNGAKYLFASAQDKSTFDANPAKYEPQFGGYCAYAVSEGHLAPITIDAFMIVNGRLLMQYDFKVKKIFEQDPQGRLARADKNWPGLVEKNGH
jgi:YHS domain-containing protein